MKEKEYLVDGGEPEENVCVSAGIFLGSIVAAAIITVIGAIF